MATTASPIDLQERLAVLENENRALREKVFQFEQEERSYRHLYENAPVGMYEVDFEKRRCVSVNRTVLDYTGYSREEFLDMDPVEFLTEESRLRFFERYAKIQRGETVPPSVEFQIKVKNGKVVWALLEIRFLRREGRIVGASVVLYNIDERKRAFMALEKSEERFRRLVETMSEGLIILDSGGRIAYVNKHLEEISGYRSDELVGKALDDFLTPEASGLIHGRATRHDGQAQPSYEITWQRKTGETQVSIVSPQVLDEAEDGEQSSFAVITDITPAKMAENALRQREQELKNNNLRLEEMNTALRTLIRMREQDKAELERTVSSNIRRFVSPLVEKLQNSGLNERQKLYTALLATNLEEITAAFGRNHSPKLLVLTPTEMEVVNLVRHGRTTKEIASLLNISTRTVDMHRHNIRRKLGLHGKHTNLRSYLLSL